MCLYQLVLVFNFQFSGKKRLIKFTLLKSALATNIKALIC
jgi:hypothetical protein